MGYFDRKPHSVDEILNSRLPSPLDNFDWGGDGPPIIIGLIGAAGAGKTAIALELAKSQQAHLHSFARALRLAVSETFNIDPQVLTSPSMKDEMLSQWGLSARQILQRFGTEVARSVHPDVWVHALACKLRTFTAICNETPVFVIDDVRFENEIEFIHAAGGIIIEVSRPGVEYTGDHSSARDMSDYADTMVNNHSTVEEAAGIVWQWRHANQPVPTPVDEPIPYIPMHNERGPQTGWGDIDTQEEHDIRNVNMARRLARRPRSDDDEHRLKIVLGLRPNEARRFA